MSLYSGLTVHKLKAELRCRGATIRGRKIDLIERLESYDRNQIFCQAEDEIRLPKPVTLESWPVKGFQQLQPSLRNIVPTITLSDVEAYFKYRMAVDNEETGDFKAFVKGDQLLKSNHILACSVFVDHYSTLVAWLMLP